MKKQLLIAAVAATMTSVAFADISITGGTKVNYTTVDFDGTADSTNNFNHEVDLAITGKNGDTTVVLKLGNLETSAGSTGVDIEDSYLTTKVGDVSIKAGTWDNGNNALRASGRSESKLSTSTTMGGLTFTYNASSAAGSVNDTMTVAGAMSGVKASYEDTDAGETVKLSTSVAGMNVSYLAINSDTAASDRAVVEVSGSFGGMGVKIAQASADASTRIESDSWMGDFETGNAAEATAYDLGLGQDVTSVELSTSMAGNSVKFINTSVDGGAVANTDMSFNKIIITRPLANGTTFEATYTDLDDSVAANDSSTLDLELAVKF
jgi:hypothetical protein